MDQNEKAKLEKQLAQMEKQLQYNINLIKKLPEQNQDLETKIAELKEKLNS